MPKQLLEEAEQLARSDAGERELSINETIADILDELKKLRSKVEINTTLIVLLVVGLGFYIFIEMKSSSAPARSRQSQTETWRSASAAMDNMDYDKAAAIAQRLTDKNPTYYYGYSYLGYCSGEKSFEGSRGLFRPRLRAFSKQRERAKTSGGAQTARD